MDQILSVIMLAVLILVVGIGLGLIGSAILDRYTKRRKSPGIPVVSDKSLAELAETPAPEPKNRCYAVEARRLDSPMVLLVVVSSKTLAKLAFDQMIESCLGAPTFMVRAVQLDNVKSVHSGNPAQIKGEVMSMAQNGYPEGQYVSVFVRLENEIMADMSTISEPFMRGESSVKEQ